MSASRQQYRSREESEVEDAWELMDRSVGEEWTAREILNSVHRKSNAEIDVGDAREEAEYWNENYDMDDREARAFAESYLKYRKEHELEREEFYELVKDWNDTDPRKIKN